MQDKGLKFVAVNIRSLYPSIDEVRCKFKEFDCIGISETWLTDSYPDNLINIENFSIHRLDREKGNTLNLSNSNKKGGGVALYVGSKFKGHNRQVSECCKITTNIEQLWVLLEKPNVRKMAICIMYKPPSGDTEKALKEISDSIEFIQSLHSTEVIIMGDMNVNYRERHTKNFDLLKEFERTHNFVQLIKDPTRITIRSKTTIDLIWTDMSHVQESGVLQTIICVINL